MSSVVSSILPAAQELLRTMPNIWNKTSLKLPEESRYVILDALHGNVYAKLEKDSWMLTVSLTKKCIKVDLDLFPLWRYPTNQELRDFENLKSHNWLARS